ncbi:hypothetical protein PoB_001025500 [Plakobranchus ocellatus]|uniref:Uncharacterized protein n=1 Tax=Plakobranchus ocellatus TaxID=259542 RepID=A0AAV3YKV9_9GAST|nr:hypothetical protein PoB_001025500 [Plakobranchus ocellatus]
MVLTVLSCSEIFGPVGTVRRVVKTSPVDTLSLLGCSLSNTTGKAGRTHVAEKLSEVEIETYFSFTKSTVEKKLVTHCHSYNSERRNVMTRACCINHVKRGSTPGTLPTRLPVERTAKCPASGSKGRKANLRLACTFEESVYLLCLKPAE